MARFADRVGRDAGDLEAAMPPAVHCSRRKRLSAVLPDDKSFAGLRSRHALGEKRNSEG
jgi:hypothetical protein